MTTTAAAVATLLRDLGIDRVFGLPGGEILALIDELRRAGVDFVLTRHEANAGLAAAVYGKLRGQPGVVLTTLGPGAANLMLPVSNAWLDQEPLLAISAQRPSEHPDTQTHQWLPLHDVYRPVTKYCASITPGSVWDVVPRALGACMTRPFGPAYLTLSARDATEAAVARPRDPVQEATRSTSSEERERAAAAAARLVTQLADAKRPLVMIGLGVSSAEAPRLREWLTRWNLPVAVTPKVKGIVDETAPNFVGVIGGMAADQLMCGAIESSDLRIGFGLDPVEIDKTWHAELPIHWVLESPNATGIVPDGAELVSHAALLDVLLSERPPRGWQDSFADVQRQRREMLGGRSVSPSETMWPGDLIQALATVVPPETIVTTDVGSHKFLFGQFWPSRHPETFWMSNGLSGMGYGISAALGASLARPGVPVLAAVGDGGFSMNCQELETAERVGATFITVVLEDGSYSLIKLAQEGRRLEPYGMNFGPIDTVKIAEACGVEGLRTNDPDKLATAVKRAIAERRSLVVGVPINYADYRRLV